MKKMIDLLRPEQRAGFDHAYDFLTTKPTGSKQLYASPTGSGKSFVELALREAIHDLWIIAPREEILQGMLEKLNLPDDDPYDHRMCTPIRLRNKLIKGEGTPPGKIVWDESHHQTAESYQQLELLSGLATAVGYTATPYRGSPKSTREFRDQWGDPIWLITYEEAEAMGRITMPRYSMLPLIDDDEVEVVNGEFSVESVESATLDRLEALAQHARSNWIQSDGLWDRPTIFAFPSSRLCNCMSELLPVTTVSAATPRAQRQQAFDAVVARRTALAHINIVTEGVDLPLRRLVDCSPVMSPVKFVQQLGRITRPSDTPPEYVATNRNLLRHAYALEGCVPFQAVAEAERVFGFSERSSGSRVVGMEGIGRFKPARAKTVSGVTVQVYCVSSVIENKVVEYAALAHPAIAPVWAHRVHKNKDDGTRDWGRWVRCESPESLRGFGSISTREVSEKQRAWWHRSARSRGLDDSTVPDRKSFAVLPFLFDLGLTLR